jgi:spore coat protein CotF
MKNLFIAIAAILIMAITSATTVQIMTVRPAQPKQVLVQSFRSMMGMEREMTDYISKKTKEGWIVKSVTMMDDESWSKGIVVLEKY